MRDDCFAEDAQVKYRGAAPPQSMKLVGTTTPHFIDIPHDGGFPDCPELYEGGKTLEEKVAELEGLVNDP
jgi:hypothetical protein